MWYNRVQVRITILCSLKKEKNYNLCKSDILFGVHDFLNVYEESRVFSCIDYSHL